MEGSESDGCEEAANNIDEDYERYLEKKKFDQREEIENKNRSVLDKYSAYDLKNVEPPMGTPGSNKHQASGSSSLRDSQRRNQREDDESP